MRVLVLKANHFPVCGASRLVEAVLAHVDRERVQVFVGSVARAGAPHSIHFTSARTADLPHRVIPWRGALRARDAVRELRSLVAADAIDLVHSHDMRCDLLCRLARLPVPWIAHVHGWIGREGRGKDRLFELVDRLAVRAATEVWVGSHDAEADVRRSVGARVPVRYLGNAADPELVAGAPARAAAARAQLGLPAGAFLAGTVGRLHRSKAHALLAEAVLASGVPEMHALLLGFGPEEAHLHALAAQERCGGRVHVPGPLPAEAIPPLVAGLDVFAFPSLRESLPLAVLEAMQLGRPIVCSEVGDLRYVLDEGRAGLLVPPGDVNALAAALRRLHAEPALRADLGARARERALRVFGPQRLAAEMTAAWLGFAEGRQR